MFFYSMGVTSSGKTEIYIKIIKKHLKKGQQILFLVPEVALTEHLIRRLENYFGEEIFVYNHKQNKNYKTEGWIKVRNR